MNKHQVLTVLKYSFIFFIILFFYYVLVSNGLGNKPFYLQFRRFIPLSLLTVITYIILKKYVAKNFFYTFILSSFLWLTTFPILYKITYSDTVPFFSNHFDMVFAIYSFIGLTSLALLLTKILPPGISSFLISTLQFFIILIPIFELIYFANYDSCISEAAVMAIFQTNLSEAKEYMLMTAGIPGLIIIGCLLLLIWLSLICFNKKSFSQIATNYINNKKIFIYLCIAAITATTYSFYTALPQTGFFTLCINVKNYFAAIEDFNVYHENNFKNLIVHKSNKTFSKPSTIILVIGESASRSYMSAFATTHRDTTPWLKSKKDDPNFLIFPHAYTSRVQTVPALERALTEKNQYNNIDFNNSITIIDIAKKAGYFTSWFSNQGTIDVADTPITLVGKTADMSKWTNENTLNAQYDGTLLEYIKTVDRDKNNFIVLHFMGSHDNYQNRYPVSFAKWGNPEKNEPIIDYDNSLYYSDYVLSKVYEYAKANLNLQAMVYFSDHGTVPDWKRHPDKNPFTANRIPLFVYLSDEYMTLYPETTKALKENTNKYFTNDLIYDMMCGILNIQSPNYNETQSISSPKYKFTREMLRTNLGQTPLSEDNE